MFNKKQRIQELRQIADRLTGDLPEDEMLIGEMHYPLINKIMKLHALANKWEEENDEEMQDWDDR